MTPSSPLLLRCDASPQIGTGHAMRCLALAQAWRRQTGVPSCFAASAIPDGLRERIEKAGHEVTNVQAQPSSSKDISRVKHLLSTTKADTIVVDGYHFSADYQEALANLKAQVLYLDDTLHLDRYPADLVVNPTAALTPSDVPGDNPQTRFLLGPNYVLLRPEFSRYEDWTREHPVEATRFLLTLGGADPEGVTSPIIEAMVPALERNDELEVVTGSANPHTHALRRQLAEVGCDASLHVDARDMADRMARTHVAICAGGTTAWELAFMQTPALTLMLAGNQRNVVGTLKEAGAIMEVGQGGSFDPADVREKLGALREDRERRSRMGEKGKSVVDGYGAQRITAWILGSPHWLRGAGEHDMRQVWEWANEPSTRARSFNPDPIPWDDHKEWFSSKLADPSCAFLIAIDHDETRIGQARFDIEQEKAVISVSVGEEHRGKGHGTTLIERASQRVLSEHALASIHAYIQPDNSASRKAFERAGYRFDREEEVNGQEAYRYVKESDSHG